MTYITQAHKYEQHDKQNYNVHIYKYVATNDNAPMHACIYVYNYTLMFASLAGINPLVFFSEVLHNSMLSSA